MEKFQKILIIDFVLYLKTINFPINLIKNITYINLIGGIFKRKIKKL